VESSEPDGLGPSLSAGLRERKKDGWKRETGKNSWQKREFGGKRVTYPEEVGIALRP
jgi:hypothetical protein